MKRLLSVLVIAISTMASAAFAGDDAVKRITASLAQIQPAMKPTSISESPIPDLYQVVFGSQVIYMTSDARYLFQGDFYDLEKKVSISESAKSAFRLEKLKKISSEDMVVYKPEKVDAVITVVTDIDCPFCRKLHNEVPDYLQNNVEVRYIFMPLKGPADMRKTISVWCSDDQQTSLDIAKAGGEVDEAKCDNPIDKHLKLARELGVRGTPAILMENGEMLPGYVPFEKIVAELKTRESLSKK